MYYNLYESFGYLFLVRRLLSRSNHTLPNLYQKATFWLRFIPYLSWTSKYSLHLFKEYLLHDNHCWLPDVFKQAYALDEVQRLPELNIEELQSELARVATCEFMVRLHSWWTRTITWGSIISHALDEEWYLPVHHANCTTWVKVDHYLKLIKELPTS